MRHHLFPTITWSWREPSGPLLWSSCGRSTGFLTHIGAWAGARVGGENDEHRLGESPVCGGCELCGRRAARVRTSFVVRSGRAHPAHPYAHRTLYRARFQAVFLHRGGDPKELKKVNVRHNLAEVRTLCVGLGFTSTVPQIDQIVDVIGDMGSAWRLIAIAPTRRRGASAPPPR